MANSPQAKKRARTAARRTEINKNRRTRIKTFIGGDQAVAAEAFKNAQPEIMRGVTKGIWHKSTASRKVSRLAKRVKAMAA